MSTPTPADHALLIDPAAVHADDRYLDAISQDQTPRNDDLTRLLLAWRRVLLAVWLTAGGTR